MNNKEKGRDMNKGAILGMVMAGIFSVNAYAEKMIAEE